MKPSIPSSTAPQQIRSLTRPWANRAVHLHIIPRPTTHTQTADILSVLKTFGEIEVFKSLAHDRRSRKPNSALAIFALGEAAERAVGASPFAIPIHDANAVVRGRGGAAAFEGRKWNVGPEMGKKREGDDGDCSDSGREGDFTVTVNRSTFPHERAVALGAYHGPFSLDRKSISQTHLAHRVPVAGLSEVNLRKPDLPSRVLAWQSRNEQQTRFPRLSELVDSNSTKGTD